MCGGRCRSLAGSGMSCCRGRDGDVGGGGFGRLGGRLSCWVCGRIFGSSLEGALGGLI